MQNFITSDGENQGLRSENLRKRRRAISMTRAISLPLEVIAAIFEQVDDFRDLCHARMASRAFCAAATPFAFRALSATTTSASAQNLGRLFDLPDIAVHIREVSYHDIDLNDDEWSLKYGVFSPSHLIEEFRVTTCLCTCGGG